MQNTAEPVPSFDIADTLKLLGGEKIFALDGSPPEFLYIESNSGIQSAHPHRSNFYTLAITLSGQCTQTINEHKVTLSPGRLLFTSPGATVRAKSCSSQLEIRQLLFARSFLRDATPAAGVLDELLWIDSDKPPVFQVAQEAFQKTTQLFEKIAQEASLSREYHKQILRSNIVELLYRLNRQDKPCLKQNGRPGSQTNQLYQQFTSLVEDHYRDKKKVSEYADLLHITPKHLSEVVKQESGRTALKHIHERILQEAKTQLTETTDPAKKIAYELGFNTPSQFGRFFKREADQSPIRFRKNRKTAH